MAIRVRRLSMGIWGDARSVGHGVVELREDEGAGYRLYVGRHGSAVVVLLCGGASGPSRRTSSGRTIFGPIGRRGIHERGKIRGLGVAPGCADRRIAGGSCLRR
ncbi:hypothetical protein [Pigmentiphaga sp.]|uniref:hypothetical protein n=1 Tax=Pigmentiphaga sp. TaxID=1977564 RepID=UPI003432A03F